MPDFASVLSDNEIARVASYVRKRWGGAKQDIDAGFVEAQRARFAGKGAWQGGAEIAATLAPGLAPQPAYTGSPLPTIQPRSEEHTSELQSLMRTSYAVFCLKKKKLHIQSR